MGDISKPIDGSNQWSSEGEAAVLLTGVGSCEIGKLQVALKMEASFNLSVAATAVLFRCGLFLFFLQKLSGRRVLKRNLCSSSCIYVTSRIFEVVLKTLSKSTIKIVISLTC